MTFKNLAFTSQRLPILRTFCLFCAMGVFMLYIFAVTFFAGCVVLDERRIDARKWAWCAKSKMRPLASILSWETTRRIWSALGSSSP